MESVGLQMLLRDLRRLLMKDEVRRVVEARVKEFE